MADPGGDRQSDEEGDNGDAPLKSISIDIPVPDHVWMDRYAEYLNELRRQEIAAEYANQKGVKKPKGGRKTRKSLAEEWVKAQVKAKKAEVRAITDELGPFPDAEDKVGIARYVKRALALVSKK